MVVAASVLANLVEAAASACGLGAAVDSDAGAIAAIVVAAAVLEDFVETATACGLGAAVDSG